MHEQDDNEHNEPGGLWPAIRKRSGVIIGVIGLAAWCAMLWGMFWDVL